MGWWVILFKVALINYIRNLRPGAWMAASKSPRYSILYGVCRGLTVAHEPTETFDVFWSWIEAYQIPLRGEGVIPAACIVNSNEWSQNNPPAEKQNPNSTCRFITQKSPITSTHAQQSSQKNHLRIHHFRCCHVQFHCFTTFKAIESQDWGYMKFCREAEVIFQTTRCWIVVGAIEEGMIWNAIGAIF